MLEPNVESPPKIPVQLTHHSQDTVHLAILLVVAPLDFLVWPTIQLLTALIQILVLPNLAVQL